MVQVLLLVGATAQAAEPVVERGDSRIEAWVDLPAPPDEVFAVISDPAAVARIDGSTRVETAPDGDCIAVTTHVDHPLAKTSFQTRSCPDGELTVRQTLTGGSAMKEYDCRFRVEAHEAGSRLHYDIHTVAALPVPQFIVDRATMKGTERMLTRLRDHFEAQSPSR
jgi:carbon monoxide dehydrogenase subunit G